MVVIDVQMPSGGAVAASQLLRLRPAPIVVAISGQTAASTLEDLLRAGVTGFVTKGHAGADLVEVLERCARGEVVLASPAAGVALAARRVARTGPSPPAPDPRPAGPAATMRGRPSSGAPDREACHMREVTAAPPVWLRATPSIVYSFDDRGICTLSEGPGLETLGLTSGEMVGMDLFEVYADDPVAIGSMRRVLAGETFAFQRKLYGRLLETFLQPLSPQGGEPAGALGVVSDVTDQRRLETEAREHDRRLRSLVELDAALARDVVHVPTLLDTALSAATEGTVSSGALWTLDPGTGWMHVAAFRAARTTADEPLLPPAARAHPDNLMVDGALARSIVRARHVDLDELEDASAFFGDSSIGPWLRETGAHSVLRVPLRARGNLLGALDLVRRGETPPFTHQDTDFAVDVAERVALALDNALLLESQREALKEQAKFKALADATSDLIAITDTVGVATYVNSRVADARRGLGRVDLPRRHRPPRGGGGRRRHRGGPRRRRGRWRGDLTLTSAVGTTVARTEAFHIFHPATGDPLGTVWVAQDVTELMTAERALRAANVDLLRFKALVETCPEFIAIAALDGTLALRQPSGPRHGRPGPGRRRVHDPHTRTTSPKRASSCR